MYGRSGWKRLALAAVVAVGVGWAAPDAAAQTSPSGVPGEICSVLGDVPELSGRVCAGFESGAALLAGLCQQLGFPSSACALVDPVPPDPAAIAAYEESWVHRALRLQEELGRDQPLLNSLVPHTHNSANSTAYGPSVSTFDPNQRYGIRDQLRMDMGGIELDLHLVGGRVVLCHGTTVAVEDLTVHVGCSVDQPLAAGLEEVRAFLTAEGNRQRVILVYLENQLDGDAAAHRAAVADLEEYLGEFLLRPAATDGCAELPMEMSRQDVLDAGYQVVLVGDCGPGGWSDLVFERGERWKESGYDGSYPPHPECIDTRVAEGYDDNFVRHWEDLTFVSAVAEGTIHHLEPAVVHDMVRCGVDMIGFDRLTPFDGRLEALVWSWAPDEPSADLDSSCSYRGEGGRFFTDVDCASTRAFACRDPDGGWSLAEPGRWADGVTACAEIGSEFAVPATGWDNERLGDVAADRHVWLALGTAPPVAPGPAEGTADDSGHLPATGGTVAWWALVLATAGSATAGLATRRRDRR